MPALSWASLWGAIPGFYVDGEVALDAKGIPDVHGWVALVLLAAVIASARSTIAEDRSPAGCEIRNGHGEQS